MRREAEVPALVLSALLQQAKVICATDAGFCFFANGLGNEALELIVAQPSNRDQFDLQFPAERPCYLAQRDERDRRVFWVENSVDRGTGGPHFRGHGGLGDVALFHEVGDFQGERAFERGRFHFFERAVFLEEVPETGAAMFIPGFSCS
jgi:hypothetical protein